MGAAETDVVSHADPLVDERMTERGRVEQRAGFDKRRKRIRRMLVCIRGERRQGFDVADRAQPRGDRWTVRGVPPIDRDRRLAGERAGALRSA